MSRINYRGWCEATSYFNPYVNELSLDPYISRASAKQCMEYVITPSAILDMLSRWSQIVQ